jgi:serine/threonine-protein kinase HipA
MSNYFRIAQVTFKNRNAGLLEETAAGGTRFIYHAEWSENIACCFPVTRREHEWAAGLHPFFQHIGPEGWLREKQARVAHIAKEDDLGLLLRYGADCIGAVGVLPTQPLSKKIEAKEAVNKGRTVSGVQPKLLVIRDEATNSYQPAADTGPAPFIAKFNPDKIPTLVRNENLSLKWTAAILGADQVTEFRVDHVAQQNENALIVTRFDRTPKGEKLRAEDFAQILSKPRGQDFKGKYESSYEEAAAVIRANSVRPGIDLASFYRRLIVYILINNADAHLKNFTLLEREEGLRLSPAYDVVNVAVYGAEGYDQNLALAINDQAPALNSITKAQLEAFGEKIGLSSATITAAFRDISAKALKAHKLLPQVDDEGRDPFGFTFTETVRNQCHRILET